MACRKAVCFAALGLTEAETADQSSLPNTQDLGRIKQAVAERTELSVLREGLKPSKRKPKWKRRLKWGDRGSSDDRSQSKDKDKQDGKSGKDEGTSGAEETPRRKKKSTPTKKRSGGKGN